MNETQKSHGDFGASSYSVSGEVDGELNRVDAVHRTLSPLDLRASAKVFIVDDDLAVRESLKAALRSGGYQSEAFGCGAVFLERFESSAAGCVILDFEMPELNGLQVLERLHARGETMPVIFLSGCDDVKVGVAAVKQGAFDFLTKPLGLNVLYERIDAALAQHVQYSANLHAFHSRFQLLTPREREVMQLTLEGCSTKRIATQLGITQQTAIRHRSRVLDKMEVGNEVQLVHLVNAAKSLGSTQSRAR